MSAFEKLTAVVWADNKTKFVAPVELPPEPTRTATEILRGHLEKAALNLNAREKRLILEISDREAELADVRRAASAAQTALLELDIADAAED